MVVAELSSSGSELKERAGEEEKIKKMQPLCLKFRTEIYSVFTQMCRSHGSLAQARAIRMNGVIKVCNTR